MNEMKLMVKRYTIVKRFTFWKVSAKICNFRVPVFPSYEWNDTHPLTMTASQVYECVKVSLSEKWVLNYATSGFPFIIGFPSHERNETQPLTMAGGQVYGSKKFHFLKS